LIKTAHEFGIDLLRNLQRFHMLPDFGELAAHIWQVIARLVVAMPNPGELV
jgi:hypothetical protein